MGIDVNNYQPAGIEGNNSFNLNYLIVDLYVVMVGRLAWKCIRYKVQVPVKTGIFFLKY